MNSPFSKMILFHRLKYSFCSFWSLLSLTTSLGPSSRLSQRRNLASSAMMVRMSSSRPALINRWASERKQSFMYMINCYELSFFINVKGCASNQTLLCLINMVCARACERSGVTLSSILHCACALLKSLTAKANTPLMIRSRSPVNQIPLRSRPTLNVSSRPVFSPFIMKLLNKCHN